jgi:hypothetical protein
VRLVRGPLDRADQTARSDGRDEGRRRGGGQARIIKTIESLPSRRHGAASAVRRRSTVSDIDRVDAPAHDPV